MSLVKIQLRTIHPNPGPRDKTEEGKRRRRERRYERRKEKKLVKEQERRRRENIVNITTWNVQKMSLGGRNLRKAKDIAEMGGCSPVRSES